MSSGLISRLRAETMRPATSFCNSGLASGMTIHNKMAGATTGGSGRRPLYSVSRPIEICSRCFNDLWRPRYASLPGCAASLSQPGKSFWKYPGRVVIIPRFPVTESFSESTLHMPSVKVKENEPFDVALRRFKRSIEKVGLLTELRAREFYEKPTAERKRKLAAAVKRQSKRLRSQQLPPKMY